jgi:hypothetical protein
MVCGEAGRHERRPSGHFAFPLGTLQFLLPELYPEAAMPDTGETDSVGDWHAALMERQQSGNNMVLPQSLCALLLRVV